MHDTYRFLTDNYIYTADPLAIGTGSICNSTHCCSRPSACFDRREFSTRHSTYNLLQVGMAERRRGSLGRSADRQGESGRACAPRNQQGPTWCTRHTHPTWGPSTSCPHRLRSHDVDVGLLYWRFIVTMSVDVRRFAGTRRDRQPRPRPPR